MPELPEVETMRRGIAACQGSTIQDCHIYRLPLKPIQLHPSSGRLRRRLQGRQIQAVERLGKRVLLQLDNSETLVFEPRMTGLLAVDDVPDPGHLRVRLDLAGGDLDAVYFWDRRGLGTVQLLNAREREERLGPHRIGPDALQLEPEELRQRLRPSRRQIKVALLDQKVVAGIGNIYAAEILHRAGLHPATRCDRMTRLQYERVARATREILSEAVRYEGSTLSDGSYRNALNQEGSYQNYHQVYDQAGQPCRRCPETLVKRIVQAQRATFFCPGCQKKTG